MATCKFNVGDMVIGNHPTRYGITKKGWIGEVQQVREDSIYVYGAAICCDMGFWVDPQYFDLYSKGSKTVTEEKIVITHDGKTTVATKYCADGSKVKATARCAPEDEFDFNIGAKLAYDRLMDKINPVTEPAEEWRVVDRPAKVGDYIRLKNSGGYSWNEPGDILKVDSVGCGTLVSVYGKNHPNYTRLDNLEYLWNYMLPEYEVVEKVSKVSLGGFKVGDRVTYREHVGTVICIMAKDWHGLEQQLGVEFDTYEGCWHNCEGIPLIDGKTGTTGRSQWFNPEQLKHYDEKVAEPTPISRDGFKVGDRVNYKGHNGTVICIQDLKRKTDTPIGVEFDTYDGYCHNCSAFELADGKPGKTNRCGWYGAVELEHGEAPEKPKYYNGKVICTSNTYPGSFACSGFIVGKIYDVIDGRITNDENWTCTYQYETVEALSVAMGNTFIAIVE